jgi:hypothetical protein
MISGLYCVPIILAAAYVYMVWRILKESRRPLRAFGLCFLGGGIGAIAAFFTAQGYVLAHPIRSHGHEDWGAFAGALLYVGLLYLAPVIGFFLGFSAALAVCWWRSEMSD